LTERLAATAGSLSGQRARKPDKTYATVAPHLPACGISRAASVTGLDALGVPTWVAVRPNGLILQVSNGKGLTDAAARISAVMEVDRTLSRGKSASRPADLRAGAGAAGCLGRARPAGGLAQDWVRKLRDYYVKTPAPWPRISVLSRNVMRRLHKTFTPMELRDTTMLMQQEDGEFMRAKVPGGREKMLTRLVSSDDLRDIDNPPAEPLDVPQGSIACVSGLPVNQVRKTLKLISPCYTTLEYRHGYRVYDEIDFSGPEDFEGAVTAMISRSMVDSPYPEMPVNGGTI
jgi:hypothetical protein